MLHRSRSRDHGSAGPTNFTKEQMGDFLTDLRNKPLARPHGSRPLPSTSHSPTRRSIHTHQPSLTRSSLSSTSSRDLGHSRSSSALSYYRTAESTIAGRVSPDKMYYNTVRDPEHRRAEREETHAVRVAMDALRTRDNHSTDTTARQEAMEILHRHQNPSAPYRAPEAALPAMPTDPSDLVENDTRKTSGSGPIAPAANSVRQRSPSKRLSGKFSFSGLSSKRRSASGKHQFPNEIDRIWQDADADTKVTAPEVSLAKTSTTLRSTRNPFARAHSAKHNTGVGTTVPDRKPRLDKVEIHRNPPTQSRDPKYTSNTSPTKHATPAQPPSPGKDASVTGDEIRFKDGKEVRGDDIRAATSRSFRDRSKNLPSPVFISDDPGRPIVSFREDWEPPANNVENQSKVRPLDGRPSPSPNQIPRASTSLSSKATSAPAIPTLRDMEEASLIVDASSHAATCSIPTIAINDEEKHAQASNNSDNVPQINVSNEFDIATPATATPSIHEPDTPVSLIVTPTPKPRLDRPNASATGRPRPRHAATSPSNITPHAMRGGSTLCAQCALPIYGRTVTAAGTRFHPECFACCHCGEGLECVQFYPEPAASREARLERIDRRMTGEDVDPPHGCSMAEDDDDSLRFYCHLDYHEFFSPRCKNCKTPIEGEMIVALGSQYHPGHFFCANCGDPFDQQTPFIERDGYAWCVNCHHNRTSGKCRKCRRPVTGMVLKALDAEWHDECFRCMECNGVFEDGRYFLRGEMKDPFCSKCEARRLKL